MKSVNVVMASIALLALAACGGGDPTVADDLGSDQAEDTGQTTQAWHRDRDPDDRNRHHWRCTARNRCGGYAVAEEAELSMALDYAVSECERYSPRGCDSACFQTGCTLVRGHY